MTTKTILELAIGVARWLNGRASDSIAKGRGSETYLRRVVSLSKILNSPKVLVIPRKRWLRPDMTEKLLTGTLSLNTNKQNKKNLLFIISEQNIKELLLDPVRREFLKEFYSGCYNADLSKKPTDTQATASFRKLNVS